MLTPLGATPSPSPVCLAENDHLTHILSLSAMISSTFAWIWESAALGRSKNG
jgi:hypothetical protein